MIWSSSAEISILIGACPHEDAAGPELADDYFARKIPVGLGILNAVLNEAGFPSQVGNLSRFTRERVVKLLERERPDLVGGAGACASARSTT